MKMRKLKFPDYVIELGETKKAKKYVKFEEECYVWIPKSVITHEEYMKDVMRQVNDEEPYLMTIYKLDVKDWFKTKHQNIEELPYNFDLPDAEDLEDY